jgi:hypothetical protein
VRIIVAALALGLLVGPVAAQLRIAPSERTVTDQNGDSLRRCTLSVLRSKAEPIDKKRVVDEILSGCFPILDGMPNDVLMGPKQSRDAWIDAQTAQERREVSALVEKLAPRAKAEKADEDQVGANYYLCLERHAKVLALATNEAADLIAQASLSACPAERNHVFEVRRRYSEDWNEPTMRAAEGVFVQHLLLAIIEIRALRNVAPAPAPEPKPQKTPI